MLAVALVAAGCEITVNHDSDTAELPPAATQSNGTEVWDLRHPPTADQIGIDSGSDTAIYETRPSRRLLLRLPEGTRLRLSARYLAFSSIADEDGEPVNVDVKTATKPLGDTVETYRSILKQLGLPTAAIAQFREAARAASGTESVHSDRISGQYGDLDIGVVASYSPHSETGRIAVIGNWQP
ncbi:hypothetical protein GCM10010400_29310 [Streptomyces aculeolatus]